jgi:hypothetical protein
VLDTRSGKSDVERNFDKMNNINAAGIDALPQMFGEFGFLFGRRFDVANLRRADKGLVIGRFRTWFSPVDVAVSVC